MCWRPGQLPKEHHITQGYLFAGGYIYVLKLSLFIQLD